MTCRYCSDKKKGLAFGIFWMEKWWFWAHSSVYDSRGHAGHT